MLVVTALLPYACACALFASAGACGVWWCRAVAGVRLVGFRYKISSYSGERNRLSPLSVSPSVRQSDGVRGSARFPEGGDVRRVRFPIRRLGGASYLIRILLYLLKSRMYLGVYLLFPIRYIGILQDTFVSVALPLRFLECQ